MNRASDIDPTETPRRGISPGELSAIRARAGKLGAAARGRTMAARRASLPALARPCTKCRREEASAGHKLGPLCLRSVADAVAARRREARAAGLCLCGEKLAPDRGACAGCLADAVARMAQWRAARAS